MTAPHSVDYAGQLGAALADASPDLMRSLPQTMINALLSADADAEQCAAGGGLLGAAQRLPLNRLRIRVADGLARCWTGPFRHREAGRWALGSRLPRWRGPRWGAVPRDLVGADCRALGRCPRGATDGFSGRRSSGRRGCW